jgi:hypothetical protein
MAWLMLAAVLGSAAGAGCSDGGESAPPRPLRIATGNAGGVYAAYGQGIADALRDSHRDLAPELLTTAASVENLRLVAAGRADVGFALADACADAVAGTGPFDQRLPVVALARLYDNYVQVITRADSGIRDIRALRGHRVSTGAAESGTDLVADRILRAADLTGRVRAVNLDLAESAAALVDRRIDAFFWSGGLPTGAIDALRRRVAVRLVDLGTVAGELAQRYDDLYVESRVPPSAYGLSSPVTTVSVPNYLVVRRDLDETTAYRLVRSLFDRRERIAAAHPEGRRLNLRSAISTYPLELHPGAQRWFREAKR